ncbi:hypothetical protein CROQUDRAFT_11028, partial [Cronartium quercuum f. sp. fusiforme G11]
WCMPIHEAIQTLGYHLYLDTENYHDKSLSPEQHEQTKFVISTWILNHCDTTNDELATHDPISHKNTIDYDLYKLWKILETYHDRITEAKLAHVNKALINMTQSHSNSLKTHVEKFNALLRDYYKFRGDMTSAQAAHTLIGSLKPGYEVTIDVIYRIIKPLMYEQVKQELLDTEEERTFMTPAMVQASHTESIYVNSTMQKCTREVCVGNSYPKPHMAKDCFKKPENQEKQAEWIAR